MIVNMCTKQICFTISLYFGKELEQIPLFMTKAPETVDAEKAPALAALQDLKYELETPEGEWEGLEHKPDSDCTI